MLSVQLYICPFFTGPLQQAAVVFDSVTHLIAPLLLFVAFQRNSGLRISDRLNEKAAPFPAEAS
jgi:hypothetical protein